MKQRFRRDPAEYHMALDRADPAAFTSGLDTSESGGAS